MRVAVIGMVVACSCGDGRSGPRDSAAENDVSAGSDAAVDGARPTMYGGNRPADLHVPPTLTPGTQYPLLVVLHDFAGGGAVQYAYFGAQTLVDANETFAIAPDGLLNSSSQRFWNADPACCDFNGQNPDDVAYIGGLIDAISADWPIDKTQVFVLGHGNGGYMAYRMACDRADAIAAIGSLAGNAATTASSCNPSLPVGVLHMHGTADSTVQYAGSGTGAVQDVTQWASHDGCGNSRTSTVQLDLDSAIVGAETQGETTAGCPTGVAVDLWTMQGVGHLPTLRTAAIGTIFDWLTAHKR